MDTIRIGRVSSVNYSDGTMQVTYADRGGATTAAMPYFAFGDEYKMPQKEQMVVVLHLANGTSAGVVLGTFWNQTNVPAETGEGLFLKQLGKTAGEAYLKALSGAVTLYGSTLTLSDSGGDITVTDLLDRLSDIESRLDAVENRLDALD